MVSEFAGKACWFYIPGSNPTTTLNIYLFLNNSSHEVYESFECLASAMHQSNDFDLLQMRQMNSEFDESLTRWMNAIYK